MPSVVVHACNPSISEAQWEDQELQASLCCVMNPASKTKLHETHALVVCHGSLVTKADIESLALQDLSPSTLLSSSLTGGPY